MPDTGKIATGGFGAGAMKYVTLAGFVPNPSASTLVPGLVSLGFGVNAFPTLTLLGFAANPGGGGGGGTARYYVFGDAVIR